MGIPEYVICLLHLALGLLALRAAQKGLKRKPCPKMVYRALGALGLLAVLYHGHMLFKMYGPWAAKSIEDAEVEEAVKKSEEALIKMSEIVELP